MRILPLDGIARRCLTTALLGCTALVAAPAFAQDAAGESTEQLYRLSPVLIYSNAPADDDRNSIVAQELWVGGKVATSILDTPASVSVITQKEMEKRDVNTLEEALSYTAGVLTDYYGTDDRNDYFQIRGFQATTYRDGLTLGSMRDIREEPFQFSRVEVIKGSNSTLFGPADPGGSVNFVTKLPTGERFGEAYLTYGSFDHAEIGVDFGDALSDTLSYRVTAKLQDSELEYDYSQNDSKFVMGGLTWSPDDATSLSFVLDYLKRDGTPNSAGYPRGDHMFDRGLFLGEQDFNYQNVERTSASVIFEHDFGDGLKLRSNLRWTDWTNDYGFVYLNGELGTNPIAREYLGSDVASDGVIGNALLQYDASFGTIDSSTIAGLELSSISRDSRSFYAGTNPIDYLNPVYSGAPSPLNEYANSSRKDETQAVFLQQNFSFNDQIVATVGARHDWIDMSDTGENLDWVNGGMLPYSNQDNVSETTLRAALTYKVTDEVSAYASYVESVAPPALGTDVNRGHQYEVGVKYAPAGTNALISAAVYDLTKENEVTVDPDTFLRSTLGETRARGFEIEGKAELYNNFNVIGSYTYTDAEIVSSDPVWNGSQYVDVAGNAVGQVPYHMASLWVDYTLDASGNRGTMNFGFGARYVGSYYFANDNSGGRGRSDATVLLDAAVSYAVREDTDLVLNISNLLDEQHVVGRGSADYYNPGRNIAATLRHRW